MSENLELIDRKAHIKKAIEGILFAAGKPVTVSDILEVIDGVWDHDIKRGLVEELATELMDEYNSAPKGISISYIHGGGWQMETHSDLARVMENMFSKRPRPLSKAAQQTLAIIAYRKKVTRAEVEYIRGTDSGSIIKNLLDRGLIKGVGRREVAGRPLQFSTTEEFLRVYDLNALDDLPPLESFQPPPEKLDRAMDNLENKMEAIDPEKLMNARPLDGEIEQ